MSLRRVHEEQDLFAISGSLLEPGTGISASGGAGAVAAAPEAMADMLAAAAPQQAAAAALRAPFSGGRPRVVAATLAPADVAGTSAAAAKQPRTLAEAAVSTADQPVAMDTAGRKRDRPVPVPSEDGDHAAPEGRRHKKKRKRQDGMPLPTGPNSAQPAAAAPVHVMADAAEAADVGRDAAPDGSQRQHKKQRREMKSAVAPAASLDAHSRPQQLNGLSSALGDFVPPVKKSKKRRREEGVAVTAEETQQAAELADDGAADRKKRKKQKRLANAAAMELPNGYHSTAGNKTKAQTTQIAPQTSNTVGRTPPNGVMPHQTSLTRKKLKAKHGQGVAAAPLGQ